MPFFSTASPWDFLFGLLGSIMPFGPLPTYIRKARRKSFRSFPYIVALFTAMVWIYYAMAKTNGSLLITINSIGCVIEVVYIAIFVTYTPTKPRTTTVKTVASLNFAVFWAIQLWTKGDSWISALGWICVALSASVFGAPLSIIKQVIRTKRVEFMTCWLYLSRLWSACYCRLFYGTFLKDLHNIAVTSEQSKLEPDIQETVDAHIITINDEVFERPNRKPELVKILKSRL